MVVECAFVGSGARTKTKEARILRCPMITVRTQKSLLRRNSVIISIAMRSVDKTPEEWCVLATRAMIDGAPRALKFVLWYAKIMDVALSLDLTG